MDQFVFSAARISRTKEVSVGDSTSHLIYQAAQRPEDPLPKVLVLIYAKIILFQEVPIYFLIFFEVFWYEKNYKYGVHGPRNDH